MNETLLTILIFMPFIVAVMASLIMWNKINKKPLFIVTLVFSLLGIQSILAPAVTSVFITEGGNLTKAASLEAFNNSVISSAVMVILLGSAFAWWLSRVFIKP